MGTRTGADFVNTGWDWRQSDIDWINRREETLARDQARIDELGRKRQSVGLTASEEIEFQALMNKLNLMMDPTQRTTIKESNKLVRTSEKPETPFEAAQRQQLEDQRFFDELAERRRDIMTGSLIDRDERMRELEAEFQVRSAREAARGMTAATTESTTEKARVEAKTAEESARQIQLKRQADIRRKQQIADLEEEARAAGSEISEMMIGVDDSAVLAEMNKLLGQLKKGVSPQAVLSQAEALAAEGRRREQLKLEAAQRAEDFKRDSAIQREAAQKALIDYRGAQSKDLYRRRNEQEIRDQLNAERVRVRRISGMISALEGASVTTPKQDETLSDLKTALEGAEEAIKAYEELVAEFGGGEESPATAPAATSPAAPAAAPSAALSPSGQEPAILIGKPDPSELVVGKVYQLDGLNYIWAGTGFRYLGR
jgi:hypothetical protein